jgi:HAD superfamily hydrolase (TIGR01509 family)
MNIIIPLGGKGIRFLNEGYKNPKPLINIFNKSMIQYVVDSLLIEDGDNIFIIYNKYLEEYNFSSFINKNYPIVQLIKLENDTAGASETLLNGIKCILDKPKNFKYNNKCLVIDCDTFYRQDIVKMFRNSQENAVFYTTKFNEKPIYSYIKLDNDSNILDIAEKNKISNNANTGAYGFNDIEELYKYCNYVIENGIQFNNEPYTSCVIKQMLIDNKPFRGYELKNDMVISLGTPEELKQYLKNAKTFLFDLDGTIVITDDIYFNVWFSILDRYNIELTNDIFQKFIQGNNDKYVINALLPNIDLDLKELSNEKDFRFIENINKIKVVEGIENFIKSIKMWGHNCCIVTNCNRIVADFIVKFIKIEKYIDFIVCGDECVNGKPHPEPYLTAMSKYNTANDNCFIFEDSKTGILSGKSTNPQCLIGIETIYDNNELINYGANISIKNYLDLDINKLIFESNNSSTINIKNMIKCNLYLDNADITIDEIKLKGGYIADVIKIEIKENNDTKHYVFKFENPSINSLSTMAKQLDLYEREYYFYEAISKFVNIKIPNFASIIKNKDNKNIGLMLENLFTRDNFKLNLNLKNENIDVSLKIIDNMAKLHSKFWNKDNILLKQFPKLKKMNDPIFYPFLKNFLLEKIDLFKNKWTNILSNEMLNKCDIICADFENIQTRLSNNNLTFIHGDIKSANIFFDMNNREPYFIDWQHCALGKGTQDLIFFIIESFNLSEIALLYPLFKHYYYKKLLENNIINYTFQQYEKDIVDSLHCMPFFTAIWFGSTPNDELIDKNFPFFFIQKLFYIINLTS